MPGPDLPEMPASLKSVQGYLKIATEHDIRDPVVSYWVRLYSLQTGLKVSAKTAAENNYLLKLMDWLESTKKLLADNEAITNEVAAQAHLENWALKLFLYADEKDRQGIYNKSVIQSFYTAGLLYDVLTTFGELTEEAVQNRKYAKWKASYIHNCLKNGETPVPGPMREEGEDDDNSNVNVGPGPDDDLIDMGSDSEPAAAPDNGKVDTETKEPDEEPPAAEEEATEGIAPDEPEGESAAPDEAEVGPSESGVDPGPVDENSEGVSQPTPPPTTDAYGFPSVPGFPNAQTPGNTSYPTLPTPVTPAPYNPTPTPTSPSVPPDFSTPKPTEGAALTPEQLIKVSKYIKWAGSAVNYDDIPTTIDNLQKALRLLTTGQDS